MAILSSQHHSFDIALATKYGMECAVLIHHFQHWIRINRGAGRNIREGRAWTYQSRKEIALHFPYWSVDEVRRLGDKLVDMGVLLKGNFSKNKFDKTIWYAFVDEKAFKVDEESQKMFTIGKTAKSIGKSANGCGKTAKCINTDTINTDTETQIETLPPNPLKKGEADKPPLVAYGSFVKLKESDYNDFCHTYGQKKIDGLLEEINDWIASGRGKPYKDYAAGIRTWIRKRPWEALQPIEPPKLIYRPELPKIPENPKDVMSKKNQEWLDNLVIDKKSVRYYQRCDKIIIEPRLVRFALSPPVTIMFDDENFEKITLVAFNKLIGSSK
jgi:hypothetical protein